MAIVDATGAAVPSQLSANGTRLVFVAPAVPAFGYSTFFIVPAAPAAPANESAPAVGAPWTSPFTNAYYTLTPGAGGLAGVLDLATGAPLFDTSHYDAGEWMELQYTGMGASETHALTAPWYNATTFARLGNLSAPIAWTCTEAGPVRTVFATAEVPTAHSRVQLVVEAYAAIKRLDVRVRVLGWDSAFGVVNRVVFPVAGGRRNVSYAAPYGVVRVGEDEAMPGFYDMWETSPPPTASAFERGWASRPREVGDWVRAEAGPAAGVTIATSVGAFDWIDPTGAYPADATVLAPEMMLHTNSNRSPFLPEPGDHDFLFSIASTPPGWEAGWRAGVAPNNPLRSVTRPLPAPAATDVPAQPLAQSFVNASGEVWVTAVKKEDGVGRDGLIVRLFAVAPDEAAVRIACAWTLAGGAATTNLIELDAVDVPGSRGASAVDVQLGGFAIETLRLGVLGD